MSADSDHSTIPYGYRAPAYGQIPGLCGVLCFSVVVKFMGSFNVCTQNDYETGALCNSHRGIAVTILDFATLTGVLILPNGEHLVPASNFCLCLHGDQPVYRPEFTTPLTMGALYQHDI
jgi:hypothetical protein